MNVLIIIGIIIGIIFIRDVVLAIDDATRSSRWEKKWEKEQKKREKEIDKSFASLFTTEEDIKKGSDKYYHKYKNSAHTMEIISLLKPTIPDPKYNWTCELTPGSVQSGSTLFNFSSLGYKDLSSSEQVYGLARAIAYNLGYGFEATIHYYDSCYEFSVQRITKPVLREF